VISLTKKIIPTQKLTQIANSQKGLFVFKTDARNQFHPYELLNFTRNPKLIVPLSRTSRVTEKLLDQYGFDIQGASYIDILSKHINSGLTHPNTTYLHRVTLSEIHDAIVDKIKDMGPGPKTLFIDDFHSLVPHHGELNARRFIDNLSKNMEEHRTKTIVLTNHSKLPKEVSKFLLSNSEEVIEIPN